MYSQHSLQNDVYHSQHHQHDPQPPSLQSYRYHQSTSPPPSPTGFHQSTSNHETIHHHQAHDTDLIGRAVHFSTGQFTGQTIRMELQEIQKADLGRKSVHDQPSALYQSEPSCSVLPDMHESIADPLIRPQSSSSECSTSIILAPIGRRKENWTMSPSFSVPRVSPASVSSAKFILAFFSILHLATFKFLVCYVLWIYFLSQWNRHPLVILHQIFPTKVHCLHRRNHRFHHPLPHPLPHLHIVLTNIILHRAIGLFLMLKHPQRRDRRDPNHLSAIIRDIFFPRTRPQI